MQIFKRKYIKYAKFRKYISMNGKYKGQNISVKLDNCRMFEMINKMKCTKGILNVESKCQK